MRAKLAGLGTRRLDWAKAVKEARGLSYAELARSCEEAAKEAILDDSGDVSTRSLLHSLEDRRSGRR
jgi:hypothetical protein